MSNDVTQWLSCIVGNVLWVRLRVSFLISLKMFLKQPSGNTIESRIALIDYWFEKLLSKILPLVNAVLFKSILPIMQCITDITALHHGMSVTDFFKKDIRGDFSNYPSWLLILRQLFSVLQVFWNVVFRLANNSSSYKNLHQFANTPKTFEETRLKTVDRLRFLQIWDLSFHHSINQTRKYCQQATLKMI